MSLHGIKMNSMRNHHVFFALMLCFFLYSTTTKSLARTMVLTIASSLFDHNMFGSKRPPGHHGVPTGLPPPMAVCNGRDPLEPPTIDEKGFGAPSLKTQIKFTNCEFLCVWGLRTRIIFFKEITTVPLFILVFYSACFVLESQIDPCFLLSSMIIEACAGQSFRDTPPKGPALVPQGWLRGLNLANRNARALLEAS